MTIDPAVLSKLIAEALKASPKKRPTQSGKNISVAKKVAKDNLEKADAKRKARNERAKELRLLKKQAATPVEV